MGRVCCDQRLHLGWAGVSRYDAAGIALLDIHGHNANLTGNQLSSDSSDEPIIKALQRGVRVVELDLWPDDKGGIKVGHSRKVCALSV